MSNKYKLKLAMHNYKKPLYSISFIFFLFLMVLPSCNDTDVPSAENEEEVIDVVRLTFSSATANPLIFEARDPDGEGTTNFAIPLIKLQDSTTYQLTIQVENSVTKEDITSEIALEGDEHMFFFSFTEDIFIAPAGDGNIDNRNDELFYNDKDLNENPVGLSTLWATGAITANAVFRVLLKHQPGIKSEGSTAANGETDIDLEFAIEIE